MSDASQLIAQQIAAAGITPGELTPVGTASKVYVDQQDTALQTNINSVAGVAASAQQTATAAQTASGQAVVTANAAKSVAESAASVASTAQSTASAAKQAADTAQDAADAAQERADAAYALAEEGGSSGPGFGSINGVQAAVPNDSITFAAGTGMAVSTDPATKTVTYTAQGSSAPGAHASTHLPGGSDPIQTATTTEFGLTQLNDAINSTSTTQAGTANAVRKAYDRGSNALTVAQTPASTTAPGRVQLNDTNTSTAVDQALTANAGRVTYEIATALGSTTQVGRVQMYDGIDSTRTDLVATANAVRIAASMGGGGGGGTTAPMTYYVDGVAGNDANDGLTQATAVKTPQVAHDKLVTLSGGRLNHDCSILVKGAQTYASGFNIGPFYGIGILSVKGQFASESVAVLSGTVEIKSCSCQNVSFQYFNLQSSLNVRATLYFELRVLTMTVANAVGINVTNGSNGFIAGCTISNRVSAITAAFSRILSQNNTGTGNTIGLTASGAAKIGKIGTQATATTAESQSGGGVITA